MDIHTQQPTEPLQSTQPTSDVDETGKEMASELELIRKQSQEYLDGWKRTLADFDNFKKDNAKRLEELVTLRLSMSFNDLLQIIDLFDGGLHHVPEKDRDTPWYKGFQQVQKRFQKFLHQHHIERIHCTGKQFDPFIHEAVTTASDPKKKDNEILGVISHGYTLRNAVIKPAQVIVNKLHIMNNKNNN